MDATYTIIDSLVGELPEIPPDSILSRTLHDDDQVKVVLFGFAAGQELSEHTSAQPAVLHLLEGEADLTLGPDQVRARPGTWVHMPARLPHRVVATKPVVMLLLLLKSAPRG